MTLSKHYDASSPFLAHAAQKRRNFREVVLSVCRARGNEQVPYLRFALSGCTISGYGLSADAETEGLIERFSLSFERMLISYMRESDDASHQVALIM